MPEKIVNFDSAAEKAKVLGYVRNLTGKHRVTIVRERNRRSDAQNRYLWGIVYPYVASGLLEAWGEARTEDEIHIFLKNKFLAKPVVNRNTGEVTGWTHPTSAWLTVGDFCKYVDAIIAFAASNLNVAIPAPDEELRRVSPAEALISAN